MIDVAKSPNINYVWSRLMIEELIRCGVDYFCLAPGSRCAPLTIAVAQNNRANHIIHFDERGAAFHALGYIAGSGRPAALICTSGTAVANMLPAVIEASKKKLPLILLTADRPPELRLTGAPQAIEQVGIFSHYVRWAVDLPCPTKEIKPEFVLTTVGQAVYRAKGSPKGPVHLNCMYREPLVPEKTQSNFSLYLNDTVSWQGGTKPFTHYSPPTTQIDDTIKSDLLNRISDKNRGIVVVGKLSSPAEEKSVIKLAQNLNWPVFPDVTSGLRLGTAHSHVIHFFDQLLISDKTQEAFKPECVLHLGGRMTSKRWYQFIAQSKPAEYIMVNHHPLRNDPLHNVTLRIEAKAGEFCDWAARQKLPVQSLKYVAGFKKLSEKAEKLIDEFLSETKVLNEIFAARTVTEMISPRQALFAASSMPIRDLDMYGVSGKNSVAVGSNRGASGIDGTIASAIGYSIGQNKAVTVLIGDLAFLHDVNSLAMLETSQKPLTVIVLNNNGGGIFSFLPIGDYPEVFERYFGTPHHLTFEPAAKMFKVDYECPSSKEDFIQCYQKAVKAEKSSIIEIKINRTENHKLHFDLQKKIRAALNRQ